jgi:fructose-1,6-bisphosphatase/inositol monophosphatase family enzyme
MGGEAVASPHCWVVDPHDGTGAFLDGRRGSSVSIALLRDRVPVLGVVYAYAYPGNEGDLISWAEGCGPVRRNGELMPARLDSRDLDRDAIVAFSYVAAQSPAANARAVAPARFLSSIAYRLAKAMNARRLVPIHGAAWDAHMEGFDNMCRLKDGETLTLYQELP